MLLGETINANHLLMLENLKNSKKEEEKKLNNFLEKLDSKSNKNKGNFYLFCNYELLTLKHYYFFLY